MGGCATKPKDSDCHPESLPSEVPGSPKKAEGENAAQENNNGGQDLKEEPLVDLSEPHDQEAPKGDSSKTADEELVSGVSQPTEDNVEAVEAAAAEKTEDNAGAADETTEPIKEEKSTDVGEIKAETDHAAPTSEDKSDAPLVTV